MAGGNQLAVYKSGRGFELGTTINKSSGCSGWCPVVSLQVDSQRSSKVVSLHHEVVC